MSSSSTSSTYVKPSYYIGGTPLLRVVTYNELLQDGTCIHDDYEIFTDSSLKSIKWNYTTLCRAVNRANNSDVVRVLRETSYTPGGESVRSMLNTYRHHIEDMRGSLMNLCIYEAMSFDDLTEKHKAYKDFLINMDQITQCHLMMMRNILFACKFYMYLNVAYNEAHRLQDTVAHIMALVDVHAIHQSELDQIIKDVKEMERLAVIHVNTVPLGETKTDDDVRESIVFIDRLLEKMGWFFSQDKLQKLDYLIQAYMDTRKRTKLTGGCSEQSFLTMIEHEHRYRTGD